MPGKHDQSTHGKGGKGTVVQNGMVKGTDQTKWAIDTDRDLNVDGPFSYGEYSDPISRPLVSISTRQGFDGKPTKGSVDKAIADGGLEIHRGIIPHERSGTSAESIDDRMVNGNYEPGKGTYGGGYYFSTSAGIAKMYADAPVADKGYKAKPVKGGLVRRAALHKDAKIVDYADIQKQHKEWRSKHIDQVEYNPYKTDYIIPEGKMSPRLMDTMNDPGHFAALLGYDAIRVPLKERDSDRRNKALIKKRIGNDDLGDEIVVINRTALVVDQ